MAASTDVQIERSANYAPMDWDVAQILSEYLDEIIDAQDHERSASLADDVFNEWFESTVLIVDAYEYVFADTDRLAVYVIPWLNQRRLMVRRTQEVGDGALGETYNLMIEWSLLRSDMIDPSYTNSYVLMIPYDRQEEPKLLMCQQQSLFHGNPALGLRASTDSNESNYHEADVLLRKSYYDSMAMATEFDAERLFDELTVFYDALTTRLRMCGSPHE